MKKALIVAALSLAGLRPSVARTADVAANCTLEQAVGDVQFAAITRNAEIAKQQKPVLDAFEVITRKAKDPNRPLKEQLSKDDIAQFGRLQQRQEMLGLFNLIESGHERDAKVIQRLFTVSNNLYVGGREPQEGDQDHAYFLLLVVTRLTAMQDDLKWTINTPSDLSVCNVVTALHLIEYESLQKLNQLDADSGLRVLKDIAARNHMTKIDRDKLGAQDRAALDRVQRNVMAPAEREKKFIGDVENLKDLWKAALLAYESNKKDVTDSAGHAPSVGTTLAKANLTARSRFLLRVLDKIAEDFPSEYVNQLKLISRFKDQIENNAKR